MKTDYEPNIKNLKFKAGDLYLHVDDNENTFKFYYKKGNEFVSLRDLRDNKVIEDKFRLLKDNRLHKLTKTYVDYYQFGFYKYPMTFVNPDISRMLTNEAFQKLSNLVSLKFFGVVSSYKNVKLDSALALEEELPKLNKPNSQEKRPTVKKDGPSKNEVKTDERVK